MDISVVNNPDQDQYEAHSDGKVLGYVHYRQRPDGVALTHTEVRTEFEGKGVGSALARGALDAIRAQNSEVIPLCPFISSFIRRHPEYADIVVDRYRPEVQS